MPMSEALVRNPKPVARARVGSAPAAVVYAAVMATPTPTPNTATATPKIADELAPAITTAPAAARSDARESVLLPPHRRRSRAHQWWPSAAAQASTVKTTPEIKATRASETPSVVR